MIRLDPLRVMLPMSWVYQRGRKTRLGRAFAKVQAGPIWGWCYCAEPGE